MRVSGEGDRMQDTGCKNVLNKAWEILNQTQSIFPVKLPYISLNFTAERTENAEVPESISND
ncbi:MAG TPA: hypothetical protein C5S37_08780 [Methanophagales archaeon]|nr:hypothetical protein [Methanophagales archaeon]